MSTDKKTDIPLSILVKNDVLYWKTQEVNSLKQYIQDGITIEQIAQELKRTETSIRGKLTLLAYSEIQKGGSKIDILKKYKIDGDRFAKYENKRVKREKGKLNVQNLVETNRKIDTLTNLLNLVLKNQKEQSDKLDAIIKSHV